VQAKDFTMQFHFNFYDIDFLLDRGKILEDGDPPQIVNNFGPADNFLVGHWFKGK